MRICLSIILIFVASHVRLLAQNAEIDSLTAYLPQLKNQGRVKALNRLTWLFRNINVDRSIQYGDEAIQLVQEIESWEALTIAYNYTGIAFRNKNDLKHAINYFHRALDIALDQDIKEQAAYAHLNIGNILGEQKRFEEAKNNIDLAIEYFKNVSDWRGYGYCLIRLGETYVKQNQHEKALEVYQKCLNIRLKYFPSNISSLSAITSRIGQAYEGIHQYKKALKNYQKAHFLAQKAQNDAGIGANALYVAQMYHQLEYPQDSVIYYATKSLKIAQKVGLTKTIRDATKFLSEIHKTKKDYKQAYLFMTAYLKAQKKLMQKQNQKTLVALQLKYAMKKQEIEIKLLEKDEYLKKVFIVCLVIMLCLGTPWAVNLYRLMGIRRKNHLLLEKRKSEIDAQAQNLTLANEAIRVQKNDLETKNKSLQEAQTGLQNAQDRLIHIEKMVSLGQIISDISDELNNPVNFIYTGTDALRSVLGDMFEVLEEYDKSEIQGNNLPQFQQNIQNVKDEFEYEEIQGDIEGLLMEIYMGTKEATRIITGLSKFMNSDHDMTAVNVHHSIDTVLIILNHKRNESTNIQQNYAPRLPNIYVIPSAVHQIWMCILSYLIENANHQETIQITTEKINQYKIMVSFGLFDESNEKRGDHNVNEQEEVLAVKNKLDEMLSLLQKYDCKIDVVLPTNENKLFQVILPIHNPRI